MILQFALRSIFFCIVVALVCSQVLAQPKKSTGQQKNPIAQQKKSDPHSGAKCVYVLLRALGDAPPPSYDAFIKQIGPTEKGGYSLKQLQDFLRQFHLFAEAVKMSKQDLVELDANVRVILHLNPGHFVVCQQATDDAVFLLEPTRGYAGHASYEVLADWSGNALLVSDKPINLPRPKSKYSISIYYFSVIITAIIFVLTLAWRKLKLRF